MVFRPSSVLGLSPPASDITDPNDPTFLAGQSLLQAICDQEQSAYSCGYLPNGACLLTGGSFPVRVRCRAQKGRDRHTHIWTPWYGLSITYSFTSADDLNRIYYRTV